MRRYELAFKPFKMRIRKLLVIRSCNWILSRFFKIVSATLEKECLQPFRFTNRICHCGSLSNISIRQGSNDSRDTYIEKTTFSCTNIECMEPYRVSHFVFTRFRVTFCLEFYNIQ